MLLTGLVSSVLARYGLQHASRKNWLPKNHYQRNAMECLKRDDISGAIKNNAIVRRKDPDYEEAQIVRELILMWLDTSVSSSENALKDLAAKIEKSRGEARSIERRIRNVSLLSGALIALAALIPLLMNIRTHPGLRTILTGAYECALFGAVYIFLRTRVFHAEKSPVVRAFERRATLRRKIAALEAEMNRKSAERDRCQGMRLKAAAEQAGSPARKRPPAHDGAAE